MPTQGKWSRRASLDPFAAPRSPARDKENAAPRVVVTPKVVRRRSAGAAIVNVIAKPGTTTAARTATLLPATLLGKRPRGPSPTRSPANALNARKVPRRSDEKEDDDDDDETQRTLFQQSEPDVDEDGVPRNVLIVNDFVRVAELAFGAVAVGQRKSLLLTLQNPSQVGNARVKYEGYTMASATREPVPKQTLDARFKCDMHVCTVPTEGKVTLRITFEPKEQDVNQDLVAMLRFTVNDRFRLQCEASGSGVAATTKPPSLRDRMANSQTSRKSNDNEEVEKPQAPVTNAVVTYPIESVVLSGTKRRESVALVVSPPRHRKTKKLRMDDNETAGNACASATTGGFQGSWWEKRKTLSDEEWMQRQEEGFTKWMNFVLVDSMGGENDQELATAIIENPHRASLATPRSRKRRLRIDFSSLRVLAMKRMESMWSRAAMELYRSDEITEAAGNVKNEIAEGKLVVRRDRPAYADVGLQEELIDLLNNYHPVWLCLALETVLGHRTMADEKCTLRPVMTYCANVAEKASISRKKGDSTDAKSSTRMPRQLRRVILQHLVHDHQVAKRYRLVKNLKTPVEGNGTLRTGKANPKISGREYFDALMDSFVFKFLMIVLLLDRAATQRTDKFTRFPCLFRVQPAKLKKYVTEDDSRHLKNSQSIVTEFCRLFLSREGRIDRHLKQLGYSVSFQQVPLDEVDLEITNLAVDLRDGVRLAKLLETLTIAPSMPSQVRQPLSSFLRVPALSRLQKIHNVEICLHFLQEKCGHDFFESIRSTSARGKTAGRLSFATLRDKEDVKLVEIMAKAVVDGHRERTLALLWKLISVFQLRSLVNVDKLTKEIENIKQRMSFRSMEFYDECKAGQHSVLLQTTSDDGHGLDFSVRGLLLEWCRVVCANYFVRVSDFSESFADGRALCYLLHFYHPMLLTKGEIRITTTEYSTSARAIHSERDITKALENERRHFDLVNDRVKQLGEVPVLLPEQYDSTNPPDEKVIVTFVCYLQSRLMDSSREIHAAARLKRWWRSPRIRLLMRRKKNRAARMIQRMWYTSSVKRLAIRRCRRLLNAGRMIAGYVSAWFDRSRFLRLRRAVVSLQREFRRGRKPVLVDNTRSVAAVSIQRAWKCFTFRQYIQASISKRAVCDRIKLQVSASRIKQLFKLNVEQKKEQREAMRRYQEMLDHQRFEAGKKSLMKKVHARCARKLQTFAREIASYRRKVCAVTVIQARWRGRVVHKHYTRARYAATRIQVFVRVWIKRRQEEALERFRHMLAEQDRERRSKLLRAKVEQRCATRLQHAWRLCVTKTRQSAAIKIQNVFRALHYRKLLEGLKTERDLTAAVLIQKHFRRTIVQRKYLALRKAVVKLQASARGARSRALVLNFTRFRERATVMRFKMAKWKIEAWTTRVLSRRQAQRVSATIIQKTWKMHSAYERFKLWKFSASKIQALVKGVQSRQFRFDFANFRARVEHTKKLFAAWAIARWSRAQLRRYHMQRFVAATEVQSGVRMWIARCEFLQKRMAAVKIQAHFRGMLSRQFKLDFFAFKRRASHSKKRIALWTIQSWLARSVYQRRIRRAAMVIQKNVRMLKYRSGFVAARAAAIKIQASFRGKLHRDFMFNFKKFKMRQSYWHKKMALWKLEHWLLNVAQKKRFLKSRATVIQARMRCFVTRKQFLAVRDSACRLQKVIRGFLSRRLKHDHAAFRKCMARACLLSAAWKIQVWVSSRYRFAKARQSALIKARWTKLAYRLLRQHLAAVDSVAKSWNAYRLRSAIRTRVECTYTRHASAAHIQQWWQHMQLRKAAKYQLRFLRYERDQRLERERSAAAASQIQNAWRSKIRRSSARQARRNFARMREFFATIRVSNVVYNKVIRANRDQRGFLQSIRRVQSWWRGMLVRLHEKRQAVTEQRKKLAAMALVTPDHASSIGGEPVQSGVQYLDPTKPLTLGARLEMALHLLLHGKRLQEMLFASHTIEMCTRYSRECAWKCVQLKIYNTIFAAIRGLNRSRPHVELLHQLLLVLVNLSSYQRKESKNYTLPSIIPGHEHSPVDQDDLRAVDALVDLIHVHRDMHVIFVLASRILKHYLLVLKSHTATSKEVFNQWSEAHRRLRSLHELLVKKMQVAAWTSRVPATPSKSASQSATPNAANPNANVLAKINPKTAVAIVAQLLKVIE